MDYGNILFPYEEVRDVQSKLLAQSQYCMNHGRNLVVHAPTGVGKTAASLAPALTHAMDNDKLVVFLTSRLTQHKIAIDTLQEIRDKHSTAVNAVDVVGKKWLCLQDGVEELGSGEFAEYCRQMREDNMCEYYNNLKKGEKLSKRTKRALKELREDGPHMTDSIMDTAGEFEVCPYEVSMMLSQDSHVIVTDYFYLFNPKIRDAFLQRTGRELSELIVIVDEGHNLPDRLKRLHSTKLSNIVLKRAISEANDHRDTELARALRHTLEVLQDLGEDVRDERLIERDTFRDAIDSAFPYDDFVDELLDLGGQVREEEQQSYIASVGEFLASWDGGDVGYARILSTKQGSQGPIISLRYSCLDPGLAASDVFEQSYASIVMSGTLHPVEMYAEVLGVPDAITSEYPNPFPDENQLSLIVPEATTKYEKRGPEQYRKMGGVLSDIAEEVPGNTAVFFPSYALRDRAREYLQTEKEVFSEERGMSKKERHDMLESFKDEKEEGGVLLGVASGSYGEGIDLPGDYLQCVVIVGLPLQKPDLEVEQLIEYYDEKFGKGWDYGYLYPAFNRTLQSAGRCIRSKTDRGVVVYLDERYTWDNYRRLFPESETPKVSHDVQRDIHDFFHE